MDRPASAVSKRAQVGELVAIPLPETTPQEVEEQDLPQRPKQNEHPDRKSRAEAPLVQHEHSDSLVTVRLSEASKAASDHADEKTDDITEVPPAVSKEKDADVIDEPSLDTEEDVDEANKIPVDSKEQAADAKAETRAKSEEFEDKDANVAKRLSIVSKSSSQHTVPEMELSVERKQADVNDLVASEHDTKSPRSNRASHERAPQDPLEKSSEPARSSTSTIDAANVSRLDEQSQRSSTSSNEPSLPAGPAEDSGLPTNDQEQCQAAEPATPEEGSSGGTEMERCKSSGTSASAHSRESDSTPLDWAELDKNEEREQRDEGTDESTAFLLARLEKENHALATDPKSSLAGPRARSVSRPPSFHQLKKLVSEPAKSSLRYSLLPNPPPMTELEFWSALVRDYAQTAQRLPTLTSNKIRSGIPPPLRGVVWASIAGARDTVLEDEYERLSKESSPYEKAIHKDIGRSYPGVDMFRDPDGEGQKMLLRVLSAFSLWDSEIGYCQGLGFVVGPLLMHMGDKEAFCILVRLMEHYDLRSCFLPDLSGLHLRVYQFQNLLQQHQPDLTTHLEKLKVEPLYLSQWFLSFFGVTCPLPMLIRIFDVILTEGASETLMRVALSLMRRNEKKLLELSEFDDIMQFLLGRGVWDTYNCSADDLVNDFCTWTGLVTRQGLDTLETNFKESQQAASTPTVHSAASRFLGRFWTGASVTVSPKATSPSLAAPSPSPSDIRRTNSKQSMASTLNSIESAESTQSTVATDVSTASRQASADWPTMKPGHATSGSIATKLAPNKDKDLHTQIEDLLTALSNTQREHSLLASELQREREDRDEDRAVVHRALDRLRKRRSLSIIPEDDAAEPDQPAPSPNSPFAPDLDGAAADLEAHFAPAPKRSSLVLQTKLQLRDEAQRWKAQYGEEATRARELARQLTERDAETGSLKDQLRDARARIADSYRDKQRLEKLNRDQRQQRGSAARGSTLFDLTVDTTHSAPADSGASTPGSATGGLRELKLGRRSDSTGAAAATQPTAPAFGKRVSSLSAQGVLATEDQRPAGEDALLLELVNAKTAEAVARQELEEVKGRLDALRKLVGGSASSPGAGGGGAAAANPVLAEASRKTPPSPGPRVALPKAAEKEKEKPAAAPAVTVGGGFFSGWGKRAVSGTGT